ncbi:hypothetical protein H6F95_28620 [Cyanobacteria bacterium FACHB-471]|nr:hypothetical protein [Cyanobacteria bacterium FACHB-471]
MATDKPAVMTYLSSHVYQQLVEFKEQQEVRSLSQAVEVILKRYFSLNAPVRNRLTTLLAHEESWIEQLNQLSGSCQDVLTAIAALRIDPVNESHALTIQERQQPNPEADLKSLSVSESHSETQETSQFSCNKPPPEISKRGLTGSALANRLNSSSSTVSRRRSKPDFRQWSQFLDPNKIAWEYRSITRRFHPVNFD